MANTRRIGVESSKQRAVLMDAAEAILCHEGYVGFSARKVAAKAGLTKQLFYYYFRTMDDLILAVVRRVNEHRMEFFEAALASPEPLNMLWALNNNASGATLATELTAIASHRDAIREEIVKSAQQFRALQVRTVAELLARRPDARHSASGLVMIAAALEKTIASEAALGLTEGHAEALKIVEDMLAHYSTTEL